MDKRRRTVVAILLFFVFFLASCTILPEVDETEEYTSLIIEDALAQGLMNSASVAIMDQGRPVYADGFGLADQEEGVPVDEETVYNIGSVSKLFVVVSILMLVDEDQVVLDEPVKTYLPEFVMEDPRHEDITIRMLLNHSSGLPGFTVWNNLAYSYNEDVHDELLEALSRSRLKHDPGELMTYCNDGFTLAEMVVQRVSGMSFESFLEERIFAPLDMEHSGLGLGRMEDDLNPAYYYRSDGVEEPLEVISMLASGGISSTATELCQFAEIISKNQGLLSSASIDEMLALQTSDFLEELDGDGYTFGLGWDFAGISVFEDEDLLIYGKSGGTAHYSSMLYTIPTIGVSVAITASGESFDAVGVAYRILETYLEEQEYIESDDEQPPSHEPQPLDPALRDYAGYYSLGNEVIRIDFNDEDEMEFYVLDGDDEILALEAFHHEGVFYAGVQTFFFRTVDDRRYLMQHLFSPMANIGEIPAGQMLATIPEPEALDLPADDVLWLRLDSSASEATAILETHVLPLSYYEALPGYVEFYGPKVIVDDHYAGMASRALRDLTEMEIIEVESNSYIWLSGALYMPMRLAKDLDSETEDVTIGEMGHVEWYTAQEDRDVTFTIPEGGRVIIFGDEGISYDSLFDGEDAVIAQDSLVEFIADEGDAFGIEYVS
ncbi:MAG: serine hydrolase domain-containing protein [Acholeplasmataceae bacterium]